LQLLATHAIACLKSQYVQEHHKLCLSKLYPLVSHVKRF
jgi:hypothetical protein